MQLVTEAALLCLQGSGARNNLQQSGIASRLVWGSGMGFSNLGKDTCFRHRRSCECLERCNCNCRQNTDSQPGLMSWNLVLFTWLCIIKYHGFNWVVYENNFLLCEACNKKLCYFVTDSACKSFFFYPSFVQVFIGRTISKCIFLF